MTQLSLYKWIKQFCLLACLLFFHNHGNAQEDLLKKQITVPEFKGTAKELITKIQEDNSINFSYSNKINLDFEVSFPKEVMELNKLMKTLFTGRAIGYKSSGKKVILYYKKNVRDIGVLIQTIRGVIVDEDSRIPLIGAAVSIPGSNPIVGTTTDFDGRFRLENIPVGRINIIISYLGYEDIYIPNLEVNSGKEVVLDLKMRPSVQNIKEVKITATTRKGEALNELSILSSRSLSVEETKRFNGGMDDPARMVVAYAGVSASPDGSSDIIVRGNSPKYMQWRIDGVEITSPYHMDDQNASFAALTALNKNLLTTSDFYTGAFAPEYGDVLSNVMDMKFRSGNNEKFEAEVGFGLMGTDITFEGPFKKGYGGSFLVNYRYSTIALMQQSGLLDDVEGLVTYQDATFKAVLPTKKIGTFSIFGLGGLSGIDFDNIQADGVSTPGSYQNAAIVRDYDKKAHLANFGITNTVSLSKSSYLKSSLSYSANGFDDDLFEKTETSIYNQAGTFLYDSVGKRIQTFKSRIVSSAYQAALTYNNRINPKHKLQIGTRFKTSISDYHQDIILDYSVGLENVTDFRNSVNSLNNFISWKYNLNEKIAFVSGLHNTNVLLNQKTTIEPRIAMDWRINHSTSFHAGYGKHSTTEKAHNYFTKVKQEDGSYTTPNKYLDLLKADHFVMGLEKQFTDLLRAKVELYYQNLYDLPVENNDTSYYATINEGTEYRYVDLVNDGVGKNYGVEFTLERFFDNNYYFLINSSVFESKYKTLEGVWRNTKYNGNYIVNILWGKEFKNLSRKRNKTLAINSKIFFGGGPRYIPLLRDEEGAVAVNTETNQYWDYGNAYDNDLVHLYNVNFSISYKINKKNSTHEIFLDLMNVINSKAGFSEFYDETTSDNIGYNKQMTFLPNFMYRVYF